MQDRGLLRFSGKNQTDEVNKLFIIWPFLIDLRLRSIKTKNRSADNFKNMYASRQ